MKIVRFFLACLFLALGLAILLAAAALLSPVQTWVARRVLSRQTAVQVTFDSVWASLGRVDISNLRAAAEGATLAAPSIEADLPTVADLRGRILRIDRLAASGWTLDLSRSPALGAGRPAAPLQAVLGAMAAALSRGPLPCAVSLGRADLEGDVILPGSPGSAPLKAHVILHGGGIAAGRVGALSVEASSVRMDSDMTVVSLGARGRLLVTLGGARTLRRLEFEGELSDQGAPGAGGSLAIDLAGQRGPSGVDASLSLVRGTRKLVTASVSRLGAGTGMAGAWSVDLRNDDAGLLLPGRPLPPLGIAGTGRFEADPTFARVRAEGRVTARADSLGAFDPSLARLGPLRLDAEFSAERSGGEIRVDSLTARLRGSQPVALVQSLRPFAFDPSSGRLAAADAGGDLLTVSCRGLPLGWLLPSLGGAALSGSLTGDLALRSSGSGLELRSRRPFSAEGVSLIRPGMDLARGLDLDLPLSASWADGQWKVRLAPVSVRAGGRELLSADFDASQPSGGGPCAIEAKGRADLAAMAASGAVPAAARLPLRSVTAEVSCAWADTVDLTAAITAATADPKRSLSVSLHAIRQPEGTVVFEAPLQLSDGGRSVQVTVAGQETPDESGLESDWHVTGGSVTGEDLAPVAALLEAARGAWGAPAAQGGPFWSGWSGHITVALDQLTLGQWTMTGVDAALAADAGSLDLEHAQGTLLQETPSADGFNRRPRNPLVTAKGALTFDPSQPDPYRLSGVVSAGEFDAGPCFPTQPDADGPEVEGRFKVSASLSGRGSNPGDLLRRSRLEVRLASDSAILRLLGTDVAERIPETKDKRTVTDDAASVGSVVGSLFGIKRGIGGGQIRLARNTDAVLSLNTRLSEIGCDSAAATLAWSGSGQLRIEGITVVGDDLRITGGGSIGAVPGAGLRARPLDIDLQLSAKGPAAELMASAGLLLPGKDAEGYSRAKAPLHLGGTLEHPDLGRWCEVLVRAAVPKPPAKKSG